MEKMWRLGGNRRCQVSSISKPPSYYVLLEAALWKVGNNKRIEENIYINVKINLRLQ